LQRQFQPALELFSVGNFFDDLMDEWQMLPGKRVRDCVANATTQFRGRKLRISGNQNLLDRDPLLYQQSQNDGRYRRSLPRARARFDDGESLFQWSLCGAEFRFHRRLRAEKIGLKTRRLFFSHSSSRTSSVLRNASLMQPSSRSPLLLSSYSLLFQSFSAK